MIVAEVKHSGIERNTANVTSAEALLDPSGAVASATTDITPILQIYKTASVTSAVTRQNVTYEITVKNPTLVAIPKVTVCDALPGGLLYVSSSPKGNARTGSPCWKIARLPAGRSKRFTVIANAAPGNSGKLINRATARAPRVAAAHAVATVKVTQTPTVPCAGASSAPAIASGDWPQTPPIARPAC